MPKATNPDSKTKTRLTPLSQEAVEWGTAIRQAREKLRLSERDLCDLVGFSQTKLNKIENGRAHLTLADLRKIVNELGIKPGDIVKDWGVSNQVTQTSHDQSVANGVVYHQPDFEPERKVWERLVESGQAALQEIKEAKDETIAAQQETIAAKNQVNEALVATNEAQAALAAAQQETIWALKLALEK